jgi:uncharacterized membrane protein
MSAPKKSGRRHGLDALRGLAVFLMIEQHIGIWVWAGPARGEKLWDYPGLVAFNALGGMAAPLFVSLAGVGSALFVAANRPRTDSTLVRRGLVLMLFGLALNFMSPSWFSWGSWFVLHMMGFAMALGPVWRRLSNRWLLVACGVVLVATVVVRVWLHTPPVLDNKWMRNVGLPGGALRLAVAESQFPILPWLTFYLAGFVSGRWLVGNRLGHVVALALCSLLLGGGGYGLWKAGVFGRGVYAYRAFELHVGFFPASVAIVGLLLGGALLLIAGMSWLERKRPLRATNPMVTLGRISLTLLMIHVPLFRDLSRPVHVWHGLSSTMSLLLVFGFFTVALLAAVVWKRVDYRFGAEWLLRKIAG